MISFTKARPQIFYGWWVALACGAIVTISAGVSFWSFGVLILPLEQEFGWLRGEISVAFSLSWLVIGLLGPLVGRMVDRYGAQPLILWGSLSTGLCFLLLATTASLWQFYLYHALLSFCRNWMFFIPLTTLVTRWFVRRRATALAISTSGFPLGSVLFLPLLTFTTNAFGWRWTYLVCGAALFLVAVPLALWVLRSHPRDRGLTPDGDPERPLEAPSAADFTRGASAGPALSPIQWTAREALGTKAFWLLAFAFGAFFFTQVSFVVHAIPFFVSRGLSAEAGAGAISASSALAILLRFPFGYLIDRIQAVRAVMLLAIVSQGAALLVLLASVEPLALGAYVALWGFTIGGLPLLETALIIRAFGDRHYGALLGTLGLIETFGNLLGPVLAGAVFDTTGSYSWAIILMLLGSLVAFTSLALFRPPTAREPAATLKRGFTTL